MQFPSPPHPHQAQKFNKKNWAQTSTGSQKLKGMARMRQAVEELLGHQTPQKHDEHHDRVQTAFVWLIALL